MIGLDSTEHWFIHLPFPSSEHLIQRLKCLVFAYGRHLDCTEPSQDILILIRLRFGVHLSVLMEHLIYKALVTDSLMSLYHLSESGHLTVQVALTPIHLPRNRRSHWLGLQLTSFWLDYSSFGVFDVNVRHLTSLDLSG